MKVYALILLIAALGLTGCDALPVTVAGPVEIPPAAEDGIGTTPIGVTRAVALFDSICGASLPDFTSAVRRMADSGINKGALDADPHTVPTIYSPTEDVSFQVQDGPGQGRTCSMVFGTTETVQAARAGFSVMGQFVETPLGPGALYRRTQAVVLIGRNAVQGDTTYLNLRLLSER